MTRRTKLLLVAGSLFTLIVVVSACDITLPTVDCSGINQPDNGGLVCLGANALVFNVIAFLISAILGLGSAIA